MAIFNVEKQLLRTNNDVLYEVCMTADQYGNIITPSTTATSAFGEPVSVQITPIIQLDALYGLDPREFQAFAANGGSYESTGLLWKCHAGTGPGGYGVIRTNRVLRYRPGQGALARFTAAFEQPQAGITLRSGLFAQEQALNIGYNGTRFGIVRINGGKAHIHQFTVTSGGTGTVNITLNGITTNIAIASADTQVVATTIAATAFPGWVVEQVDSKINFLSNSVGLIVGVFSYAGTGTATSTTLQPGAANVENWTYQEDWNFDKLDGNGPTKMILDPSKLNIFQVQFRWLGAGEIRWSIEDSITGNMVFIHHEHYSNRNNTPHLDNPSFRIGHIAANLTGNTVTDAHVSGASMMGAIEGLDHTSAFTTAAGHSKITLAANSYNGLMAIKNASIYQGKINLRKVKVKNISIAAQSNDPIRIFLVLNATKSTSFSWNSTALYSGVLNDKTDGTYNIPNEHVLAEYVVAAGQGIQIDLVPIDLTIPPGNWLSIITQSGQLIQTISVTANWIEI